ncbi:selenoprotein O-like [Lingula anatina]|uniref:Selenoprotein O n=1 Tax=Lingula anatina TaxID=7574 RepID=A0A1S3IN78_LINAN|nr:selenoprotein O-like [Lingula anatina]|eukprot:XP_013399695.1 selenoprotein O-like [Lingula anatina]
MFTLRNILLRYGSSNGSKQAVVMGTLFSSRTVNSDRPSSELLCSTRSFCKQTPRVWEAGEMATLENLQFDNLALRALPIDTEKKNFVRQVRGACFSRVEPTPVTNPEVVCVSAKAMALLDLPESELQREDFAEYFSGNKLLPGAETAAHCYCGHQFGQFAGQLGDGATMYLGEVINKKGERWEIQFKGAGKTPFSRMADGRKVLRSSIREFLCSEAIHNLGIPTTRAGTCVTSDDVVMRDIFYDGNLKDEKCTIILRIAPTFIRFGSFEIFKAMGTNGRQGPSVGMKEILLQLLDYVISTFYPEIWAAHTEDKQKMYYEFYKEVVLRTARMVAQWQCVGWCHGVLNTDNMSILGLTIDYGPYGFMDRFDKDFVCNGSDANGRYSYKNQPKICKWNCAKLAEAISEAIPLETTRPALALFDEEYEKAYMGEMRKKLGILQENLPEDNDLVKSFLSTMQATGADFTNSFRCLSQLPLPGSEHFHDKMEEVKRFLVSQCCSLEEFRQGCKPLMPPAQLNMLLQMEQLHPGLVQHLGLTAEDLAEELNKANKVEELKDYTPERKRGEDEEAWSTWLETYSERLQKEVEEGADVAALNEERVKTMNSHNPKFVLRNFIAQHAITQAEKGDYTEVRRVLKVLENPYSESVDLEDVATAARPSENTQYNADAGTSSPASEAASCSVSSSRPVFSYDSRPPDWAIGLTVT